MTTIKRMYNRFYSKVIPVHIMLIMIMVMPIIANAQEKWDKLVGVGPTYITAPEPDQISVEKANKPYLIGIVFPHVRDPYWIANAYGAFQTAKELGCKIQFSAAGGYEKLSTQLQQIEDMIARGVDGIVLAACDYEGTESVVNESWKRGIPVVNSIVVTKHSYTPGVITWDEKVGILQANHIGKELNGKGNVFMLSGPAGASWAKARAEAFKKELNKKFPKIKILGEKYHEMDRAIAMRIMEDAITTFPEIDYVSCTADLQAKGAADAVRASGKKPGDIKISTLTISRDTYKMVKEGWINYVIAERPVYAGRLSVITLVKLLNGNIVPKTVKIPLTGYTNETIEQYDTSWEWAPEGWSPM